MDTIFRTFEASIDSVLDGERAVVARINTSGVDRLKTVIDPLGCDVTHFNKTRSVLWNHGLDPKRGTVPIGQGHVRVRRSERDMIGKTVFRGDEFSSDLFLAYKEGALRGWSIKAGVHEASPPTREEIRSRPELEACETIYRKWDLIEFSATPTPGNSDCLTMLVSRGLITAPEGFVPVEAMTALQAIIENVPELVKAMVERYITGSGDSWTVHAEDGKPLGHHKTKEEAESQLAAIEAHKHDKARWIDTDGSYWYVTEPTGHRIATFRDASYAEECIRAMAKPRTFEQIMTDMHVQQRAKFESQKEELLAEIMLRKWGVI